MGSRIPNSRKEREEVNRRQRKARYINAKNKMTKYPECAYNGDFFCNHVYDPENPWVWVDFRFFHTRLQRYFAVAMTTLEYNLFKANEEIVETELDKDYPFNGVGIVFGNIDPKTKMGPLSFTDEWTANFNARKPLKETMLSELNSKAQKARPRIDVKDYGPVAVGLWVTVNNPFIDEHVIRDFIKFYRSIGEPTTPGFTWMGEEVEIVPAKLNERYANQS